MPLLEVDLIGDLPDRPGLARRLAEAAGKVLGARRGAVWVRVRDLPVTDYAEDGDGPPSGVLPIFVRVVRRVVPAGELLEAEILALTEAISAASGRPSDNVHVLYEPAGAGRLAFGGKLVR